MKLKNWQIAVTLLTSIFYFFYYFGRYNYSVTIPFIQEEFGLTNTMVGLIATALTAGYAVGQFINGFLIDRYGPRIMMTLGAFLSTMANFGMSVGQGFTHLLGSWFSNGYVQAMGYGSCCKIYTNWFSPKNRGKPLGFNEFLQSFASTLIVPIGALIIVALGWRYVFVFPVLPLTLVAIVFYSLIRNYPEEKGLVVPWREEKPSKSSGDLLTHAKEAYKMALSDWRMLCTYASYGGSQYARFAIYTWVPAYVYGLTGNIVKGAWVTAAFALGGAVGSLLIGYLSDVVGKRYPLIVAGMTMSSLSLFAFALNPYAPVSFLSTIMAICGAGIEAVEVAYFLLPMDILDEAEQQATGVGCMNAWGKTFATFQGALFGLMLDLSGYKLAFLITGGISLASALLVVPIRK